MPRSVRIEYPGAYYHVMARGNRRGPIFEDDTDRRFFLKTLGEACGMTGWVAHAWVLMDNHYHLFVETPEGNLVAGMTWLQNAYSRRFNVRNGFWGRVFGDRYKAIVVEGGEGYYYQTLMDYIHLNPARAGIISAARGQSVLDYPWSSVASGYACQAKARPDWLAGERGLDAYGCADNARGRRKFVERLDARALAEAEAAGIVAGAEGQDARRSHLRRGWYWGRQEFAERLLEIGGKVMGKKRGRAYRSSPERKGYDLERAERMLKEGLEKAGLGEADLQQSPGSEIRKVAIARTIWESTTVSQSWLATHLGMRSAANVSQQLRRWDANATEKELPKALRLWLHSFKI